MHRKCYTLALLYVLFSGMPCYSYQETITHPNMSELAVKNSRLAFTLTDQLFLPSGIETEIPTMIGGVTPGSSKTIMSWLRLGSEEEDDPLCRASNHFHNPLNTKPWENSYLIDWPPSFGSYCSGGWGNRYSNIVWATGFSSPAPYGGKMATLNPWAWDLARTYYEFAFKAGTVAEREQYLADAFLSLGHILHLLQDMAVPAHVRSDFMSHLSRIGIRGFNPFKWPYEPYENYVRDNNYVLLPESLVPIRPSFLDKQTLTNYWDTNVYEATCTYVAPRLAGPYLGLAEYTNANFLSTDTIFIEDAACTNSYYFPHPRRDETDYDPLHLPEQISRAEDGVTDRVHYIHITDPPEGLGAGEAEKRAVAALRYLARYRIIQPWPYYVSEFYTDDDVVHQATAGRLLPRAVGYSASLLDYFFRGRFEEKDENTPMVETLSPASIRLNFKNASGEAFVNGTIYLYQDSGEEGEIGKTNLLESIAVAPGVILDDGAAFGGQEFKNITVTVPPGKSITDLVFTLLYVGRLGWEENAVVAKRFKAPPPPATGLERQVYAVGQNPMGIAITPDGSRVVVTNFGADSVSILDARGDQVLDTIAVGDGPYDVAIAKYGTGGVYAFVSNYWSNSISVVDLNLRQVSGTFSGWPIDPRETAVGPDGKTIYTAHMTYSALSRIDAETNNFFWLNGNLALNKTMTGIALHPDRPLGYGLYYSFWWGKSVAVFDTLNEVKIADVAGPDMNRSGAVNTVPSGAAGQYLYYVSKYLDQVSVLDTTNNQHAAALAFVRGANPMRVNAGSDGRVYVTLYGTGRIAAIKGASRELIGDFQDGDFAGPTDVAVSSDNKYLYVTSTENNKVVRLPNPFLEGGAPAPQVALFARSANVAAPTATGIFSGVPYEAEIWVDERYPLHEEYQDGRQILAGIVPGEHQIAIVAPGFQRWSQPVFFAEGENIFTPALIAEP